MPTRNFAGLRVVAFENRCAEEMRQLIANHKGEATLVPSMREIPLGLTPEIQTFITALLNNEVYYVIFLSGSGVRLLAELLDEIAGRAVWLPAMKRATIVARGRKPLLELQELGLKAALRAAPPGTWRELVAALDSKKPTMPLRGACVAVQEYGMMNRPLLKALAARGATVMRVPVYRWALPEEISPLRAAIESIVDGHFQVALFTTATQVWHLFKLAEKIGLEEELRDGLRCMVVASIGPTTSEALDEFNTPVDLVPEHATMAHLIRHAAQNSGAILAQKRASES